VSEGNANPLASAGGTDDATGVDGSSDDWAKAVLDGLRADDARSGGDADADSDTMSDSPGGSDNSVQAGPATAGEAAAAAGGASTFPPVAEREGGDGDYIDVSAVNDSDAPEPDANGPSAVKADKSDSTKSADSSTDVVDPLCASDAETATAGEGSTSADAETPPPPEGPPLAPGSVEDLVSDLERVTGERDTYLESSRRIQAEFENYRKQVGKRETEARERANESLVTELLPVLDACDGAVANGATDVAPISASLVDALTKQGLERIDPTDAPFDPEFHEAVMHDDGDGDGGPVVAEVMRAGYTWKGRVVRPAMVRVRG